ncbi:GPI ethanolamine phosphate transferase 3-like protein [Drosera capensis]
MKNRSSLKWRLISPFVVILLLHCLAIVLFTRGFLLTRTELPHSSACSDVIDSPCLHHHYDGDDENRSSSSGSGNCNGSGWTRATVDRVVIIVLDALRFDFVAPSTFFEEKKPWMDRLPILQKLASEPGSSARIFKAIADPPTTSLQRLKGLTTGGLPTFIDVGNSFGAPAIVEDNLIQQLVQSGKRVVMMGDDTWMQLFPHHFERSFPFPSFNVRDLDTVDNGCVEHLLPTLMDENWDVLIAHFLGVDHAGHIFGVNTTPMIQKLEQYNKILETVIGALKDQSKPGGLHENTLLVVMGDHGQTLNGDHGGGSPEEVETSMLAMSLKKPTFSIPSDLGISNCGLNVLWLSLIQCVAVAFHSTGRKYALAPSSSLISLLQYRQCLEFLSLLEGAAIGRVNPLLFSLGAATWFLDGNGTDGLDHQLDGWMQHYVNSLCINAWQVKRYVDVYSGSSVIGFSSEDLLHVEDMYSDAHDHWSHATRDLLSSGPEAYISSLPVVMRQVDAYLKFLDGVVELARSKWTEFDLKLMGVGLCILLVSLLVQLAAVRRFDKHFSFSLPDGRAMVSVGLVFALSLVLIRACSFLSNSYILEEGKVAIFFLGTAGILDLRYSIRKKKFILEAISSILLVCVVRFSTEYGISKQSSSSSGISPLGSSVDHPDAISLTLVGSILSMLVLAYLLLKFVAIRTDLGGQKSVINGTVLCYMLIIAHWVVESNLLTVPPVLHNIGRTWIPRIIYAVGILQLLFLALYEYSLRKNTCDHQRDLIHKIVAMTSAWSSPIILLAGKQGSLVALATIVGAWCIVRLGNLGLGLKDGSSNYMTVFPLPVTKWSLLAVTLFFCTGHWCAFDGLRYGAAFIGFDEFILIRQAILLTIETFGFSLILPIFGLPFVVAYLLPNEETKKTKNSLFGRLALVYLMYGFIAAATTTFTVLCVAIQRRHLMVWGLFAPKFVFDVVGLILTDLLIFLAALYYIDPDENIERDI